MLRCRGPFRRRLPYFSHSRTSSVQGSQPLQPYQAHLPKKQSPNRASILTRNSLETLLRKVSLYSGDCRSNLPRPVASEASLISTSSAPDEAIISLLYEGFCGSFERRAFVHGQVIGLVALDEILRLFLRGADRIVLELLGRSDFLFSYGSTHPPCFGVPAHMISDLESGCGSFHGLVHAVIRPLRFSALNGPGSAINRRAVSTCSHTFHSNTPRTRPSFK